jgi:hypothetical protein
MCMQMSTAINSTAVRKLLEHTDTSFPPSTNRRRTRRRRKHGGALAGDTLGVALGRLTDGSVSLDAVLRAALSKPLRQ